MPTDDVLVGLALVLVLAVVIALTGDFPAAGAPPADQRSGAPVIPSG
jgi:hypothetical protein